MQKKINGLLWRKMLLNGARLLDANKQYVDSLNVFPVPDGDTGTNMSLTMQSAAREIAACNTNTFEELSNALSRGALLGARGNSGVILSQILKGISTTLSGLDEITPKNFAKALDVGAEIAYKAVTKPKEGTILTVIRLVAEHAKTITKKSIDFEQFTSEVLKRGEEVLQQTPEMLPVLKKAGVIDAGGRGLLILFQGMFNALAGKDTEEINFIEQQSKESKDENAFVDFHYTDLEQIEFAYCTEFFVINIHKKTTEADINRLEQKLMQIGDSVVVVGDINLVKVHVHTNQPGVALSYALELGEIDKIKVENMLEQNRNFVKMRESELKECGLVSICAGEGLAEIFRELMADHIIEGGQTMNPSADDIASAVNKVPAREVFVLPNNKNIIMAAELAKGLTKKVLHVIPTTNIPEGLGAALAYNPEVSVDENAKNMSSAIERVNAGSVTYAVRNTQVNNFDLKEGDIIGIDAKDIVAKGEKVSTVTKELVDKMMDQSKDKDISNITLYFGADVTEKEACDICNDLRKKYAGYDIDAYFGGQPLYYYIISIE